MGGRLIANIVCRIRRLCLLLLGVVWLSGCVFYPKVHQQQNYAQQCPMVTRQLTLDYDIINAFDCGDNADACLIIAVGAPAATFVVSGSVVVIGNTLHWLEYQGLCKKRAPADPLLAL